PGIWGPPWSLRRWAGGWANASWAGGPTDLCCGEHSKSDLTTKYASLLVQQLPVAGPALIVLLGLGQESSETSMPFKGTKSAREMLATAYPSSARHGSRNLFRFAREKLPRARTIRGVANAQAIDSRTCMFHERVCGWGRPRPAAHTRFHRHS